MPENYDDLSRWFAAEVQPHEAALRAWLCGQFPQLPDVDDLVQETYPRVLRARERDEVRSPRALLSTTARRRRISFCRCSTARP